MLEYLEQQKKLTINQWKIFAAAMIGDMLDFFDFLLIAFVLAFIVKDWNLTYGESGAPLGSLFYGWLADKIGRRKVMIITILNFSIATGLMALTPEHGWVFLVSSSRCASLPAFVIADVAMACSSGTPMRCAKVAGSWASISTKVAAALSYMSLSSTSKRSSI